MKKKNIAVIDYNIGNVRSILNALEKIGAHSVLTRDRNEILSMDAIVLPGVGAFKQGMENLKANSLIDIVYKFIKSERPFLGICLGMQLLMEESEEFGLTEGLGVVKGKVIKLPVSNKSKEKLPHVAWDKICEPKRAIWQGTILDGIENAVDVYFNHSFVAEPLDKNAVLSTTSYGK
ncbi:MAG: imidazole glycerol phosphate synthase subunit HisH, partial [Candidatus Omnitrophica bacterium]|nr:imidazole glycerol phosphate synthase subunit HisH [Candidatus Omnitrophota bacterium]